MEYILAIDQGTTGSRAIAYDRRGRQAASAYQEFRQYFPRPGWVEHDPEEIWQSVARSIASVASRLPKGSIAAIGITNQRETSVLWDRSTGKPLYNAIVWQCRRSASRCQGLKRRKGFERHVRMATGLPVDAYFSATKIEWMLDHLPGARKKAREGNVAFGTTDSWVLWKLTGGATHATDFTNASRTMLFNINTRAWDAGLLKEFSVPAQVLPEVQPSSGLFGKTVKSRFLPAGIPITGIAGDQQAALFGQGCVEPGSVKNTYGTGSFILLNTGKERVVSRNGLISTLACNAKGKPCYALEGSVFIAGAAIQWLRDGMRILASAPESEGMARKVKDTAGVYFVPAFVGLGAPYWDQDARGLICGITRGTAREHLVRAALEAMCYQTRDVLRAMEDDSGIRVRRLKVDGGAAKNDFLCQFQSDILGIRLARPTMVEVTSLGAAYLSGLGCGFWKDSHEISRCRGTARDFRPSMGPGKAAALYAGWQQAVSRARSV